MRCISLPVHARKGIQNPVIFIYLVIFRMSDNEMKKHFLELACLLDEVIPSMCSNKLHFPVFELEAQVRSELCELIVIFKCWSHYFFLTPQIVFEVVNLMQIKSNTSPLLLFLQEGGAYYKQTGVGPLPVVMYNGIPYQREQLDPDELETVTMQKILETTSFYQRAVYLVSRADIQSLFHYHLIQHSLRKGLISLANGCRTSNWFCFLRRRTPPLKLKDKLDEWKNSR